MIRKILRCVAAGCAFVTLVAGTSGCSLSLPGSTPTTSSTPLSAPSSPVSQSNGGITLVGDQLYHVFSAQENQVDFSVIPATNLAVSYLEGMGQIGQLDTSASDPMIQSLNLMFNYPSPNDVVNITFYSYKGTVSGTQQVKTAGTINVASFNATSCRFTASTTDTTAPSPAPVVYLYQMTNSAGNIFTYSVPSPPA